jgi:hypothetical protein
MTARQFRAAALALPEAEERAHRGHPDFRVRGKIFATLSSDERRATVNLTFDQQETMVAGTSGVFVPAAGGWGKRGWTNIALAKAKIPEVRVALEFAWRNVAPKKLQQEFDA